MRYYLGGRGSGKSFELIKYSAENHIYILCLNEKRRLNLINLARANNIFDMPYPVTLAEYIKTGGFRGTMIKKILIDDADAILQELFGPVEIDTATFNICGSNIKWCNACISRGTCQSTKNKVLLKDIFEGEFFKFDGCEPDIIGADYVNEEAENEKNN